MITKNNRKLYRHESNMGTVMEWNDNGTARKTMILDAKYRIKKPFCNFSNKQISSDVLA